MAFPDIHAKEKDSRQIAELGTGTDSFLLAEEMIGLQKVMRTLFGLTLPILPFFAMYNLRQDRKIDATLVCIMWVLLLFSYFKFREKSRSPEKQYRVYQNVIRGFLLIFLMYISFSGVWKGDLDRLLWSYFFPLVASLGLKKKEGICWSIFFIAFMSLILFIPRPGALHPEILYSDVAIGFKLRYILSFSVICAIGIAWKYGIENTYSRLVQRQARITESEKQYREAFNDLNREMEERLGIQQALAESEEKYRQIFENSFDVIYSIDREFRLINVSPSIENVLGYRPSEVIGRPFHELGLLAPENMGEAFRDIMRIFSGETIPAASYTFIARDGTKRYAEISGTPMIRSGEVAGLISIARDITARRLAEEALNESLVRFQIIMDNYNNPLAAINQDCKNTIGEINKFFVRPELLNGYNMLNFNTGAKLVDIGYNNVEHIKYKLC